MKFGSLKSFADSKKVKYGVLNMAFIALVIAIIIMANSIVTVLASSFGWQLDMTEEQLFSVSDECMEILENASSDIQVDIIFCCDKDVAEQHYADLSTGNVLAYVHSTAKQIANDLDNVSVMYIDPVKDYQFMKRFTITPNQAKITENSVVIARRDKDGNYGTMYRALPVSQFYTFATDAGTKTVYGYNGERTFVSAILSLTHDKTPTAYFVAGHGEDVAYSTADGGANIPQLARTFMDCGFRVRYIFLGDEERQFTCKTAGCGETWGKKEVENLESFTCENCLKEYRLDSIEFNEKRQIPSDARVLVINRPTSDYGANETNLIADYLIEQKGAVMCFVDPVGNETEEHPLTNLYKLIKNQTGVTVNDTSLIKDAYTSSIGGTYDFRGTVTSTSAANVYLSALQEFGSKKPIFDKSGILEIDPKFTGDTGVSDVRADRLTASIIESGSGATFGNLEGSQTVMSVTAITNIKENEDVQSYFVVCASGSFVDDKYMTNSMYPNEEIMLSLIHSTTAADVPVNLDFKTFENYQLDISSSQASTVFVCLVTIMPLLTVAIGVVITVRRKNR